MEMQKKSQDSSSDALHAAGSVLNTSTSGTYDSISDSSLKQQPRQHQQQSQCSEGGSNEISLSSPKSQSCKTSPKRKISPNSSPTTTARNKEHASAITLKFGENDSVQVPEENETTGQLESVVKNLPEINLYENRNSKTQPRSQQSSGKDEIVTNAVLADKPAAASIPENILSPPKSETQTDETNTASSSSPASDSQLSPIADGVCTNMETEPNADQVPVTRPDAGKSIEDPKVHISKPINVIANGTIPNSGKPLMSALNKKLNKTSSRPTRRRKSKALVAMYESEISANKIGIKLCIKKSDAISTAVTADVATPKTVASASKATTSTKASSRKRSRKSKSRQHLDSDDSEYETRRKKGNSQNSTGEQRQKRVAFAAGVGGDKDTRIEPVEQSDWGSRMPEEVLYKIFKLVVNEEGCLPTLFRLGRICSLWRRVSLSSTLWKTMDLTTWMKEKYRTELKLKWFIDNRCSSCTDLNVSNWKVTDISCFLNKLATGCPNLASITLSGWKNFTSDHLTFLVDNMKKLERLDLSSINVEMNASKSAVGVQSLCYAVQKMNGRLTHLYLAHNRLACIPQIVNILSTHCPNLVLLDFSNVRTQATSHGILHIEKLQYGCQKLKVLRITNSHVTLSTATLQETMDSPGFPDLEELSVAALTDESRVMADEHLQRILKTSSKLKLLDVRGCSRLTHESLIRLPAWDIKHLFLSGCSVTRDVGSGLELIASKWAHSLNELDLAWANVQQPLDNALRALAEKGSESSLAHLNLCGSSVSEEAVKDILANCAHMSSINLSSCRGLPRGVKRLMQGPIDLQELRDVLKVQMKVKLPSQIKREQQEAAAAAAVAAAAAAAAAADVAAATVEMAVDSHDNVTWSNNKN